MASAANINPWIREGVSLLPKETKDLLPIVGQRELFSRLEQFCEGCLTESNLKLSSFFVLHGGWGVGKSRVGHEVCLEALSENVDWILDGKPSRILKPALQQGLLPIFVRYLQVTTGPFGSDLSADNWIPATAVEALSRLAGLRSHQQTGSLSKNQDQLLNWTIEALMPKGWERIKPQLVTALKQPNTHKAARAAVDVLKEIGIKHLLIVVDEIEDITDVELDGLPSDERKAGAIVDQGLLTVIPRVIKSEEVRQEFPEVNFLLLCSRAVGDLLKQVQAIERRTVRYELRTNAFSDVEDFFSYLRTYRPDVASAIQSYPPGLKEAAFFAADRNFGWFNVIMNRLHSNQRGQTIAASDLLRRFAETDDRVFDKEAIGSFSIEHDRDEPFIREAMYGLLPHRIAEDSRVNSELAARLFAKRDAAQVPLFTKLREISPPQDMRITTHLIKCGFKTEPGAIVYLPGETGSRFKLRDVMDSLKAYSQIVLPQEHREHLLICENEREFSAQLAALSPYGDQVALFAPYLHGLLVDAEYAIKNQPGEFCEFLAPSFTFLQEFHRLNRRRHRVEGFLRDSTKDSKLAAAFDGVKKDAARREQTLLRGMANAWDLERAPVQVESVSECRSPAIRMTSAYAPLNLGAEGSAVLLCGTLATDADIEQDLARLAQRGAEPIVLLIEDQDQRVQELTDRIARNVPKIAAFVVVHNLANQVGNFLVRLGLIGEAFEPEDLRTSHFNGVIQGARQHLKQVLDTWLNERIAPQGLVLRPLFYGSKVNVEDLEAFARGYAAMLTGKSFHDVVQRGNGIFTDEGEQDRFQRMVDRQIDPGPRYKDEPRLRLVAEESGERVALVPQCLLTLMERCSHVQTKHSDLERRFLFDVAESVKPKDVLRHLTEVMHRLGLIEQDGDGLRQISSHMLETQLKAADDWLDSKFDTAANAIKSIHLDEGSRLLDIRGKEARQWLKEARRDLDDLNLAFVGKPWDELNRVGSDGLPAYEQSLRKALAVVGKVRSAVQRVYDSAAERTFRYSPDVLTEFERSQASSSFPLWKRVKILQGYYTEVDQKRRELIKQIDSITEEVERRVPNLDDGQKSLPIQPLMRPLKAFRQELDFSPDKPNKTVTVGGSSFAIMTVGYKICDQKYLKALERLGDLELDLTQPGKLVAGFKELLTVWEGLCQEVTELDQRFVAVEAFFADAPATVRSERALEELKAELDDMREEICKGGLRQGTDNREAGGAAILSLVGGLKSDIDNVRTHPTNMRDRMTGLEAQAVQSLEVRYQSKYRDLMRAWTGIRLAQRKEAQPWPQEKAATYGKTQEKFDRLVELMQTEGTAYFAGESTTTFDVYVGLCRLVLDRQPIDWDSPECERHVTCLKRKNLLELHLK